MRKWSLTNNWQLSRRTFNRSSLEFNHSRNILEADWGNDMKCAVEMRQTFSNWIDIMNNILFAIECYSLYIARIFVNYSIVFSPGAVWIIERLLIVSTWFYYKWQISIQNEETCDRCGWCAQIWMMEYAESKRQSSSESRRVTKAVCWRGSRLRVWTPADALEPSSFRGTAGSL